MRALVTGATGLIGAHIVRALVDAGHDVRALVRSTSRRDPLDGLPVACFVADVMQADQRLDAACDGCDTVFHTAANFTYGAGVAPDLHEVAAIGTGNLLRSCAPTGVRRAIITSTSVVFGYSDDGTILNERAMPSDAPDDPAYLRAKLAQHRLALDLGQHLGVDIRFACPTMTLGPTWSRLGPSNGMIVAYLADPFACTFPGGCNLVSARDVAAGHLLIAERGEPGGSYILGAQNLTWHDAHTMIADLAGVAPPRATLNHVLALLAATAEEVRGAFDGRTPLATREQAQMVGRYYWYSHAKAAALGYAPAPAHDALVETVSWLAASPHVSRETRARMRLADAIYRHRTTSSGYQR